MGKVDELAAQFQQALESEAIAAVRTMADALARALPGLTQDAERAALRVAELKAAGKPGEASTYAAQRARAIASQVQAEVTRLTAQLTPGLVNGQQATIEMGLAAAEAIVNGALPEGVTLASVGVSWQRANLDAVRALIANQQGSPLGALLDQLAPDTGRRTRETLTRGLLRGSNPRVVARELGREVGLPVVRAEALARDQYNRAFRSASLIAYQQNADLVKMFRRLASRSLRTCAMCLALDGKRQPTSELMSVHVQDRCTVIPIIEVGGLTDHPPEEDGATWFDRQSDADKAKVLGPGGLAKYKAGAPLAAFVDEHMDEVWGPSLRRRPLSEVA